MQVERKKQKVISPNHWMFRLHEYVWGHRPKYIGYCPLWWNTWINLGLLVLAIPYHILGWFFSWVGDLWPENITLACKEPAFVPEDVEIVRVYERWRKNGGNPTDYSTQRGMDDWLNDNPGWTTDYPAAKQRHIALQEKKSEVEERARLKRIEDEIRKAKLEAKKESLVNVLKYFVKPALFLSACAILWGVYSLIGLFLSVFSWQIAWEVVQVLFFLSIVVGIAWAVMWCIHKFMEVSPKTYISPVVEEEESPPGVVGQFFQSLCNATKEGWEFIVNTIDIVYHKNCPLIVLSEDGTTRPIEKRPTSTPTE